MRQVRAYQEHWSDSIAFVIREVIPGSDQVAYALPKFTFQTFEPNSAVAIDPTFSIPTSEAQRLMDDLWNCGVRPSEGDSPGELAATQKHLEDYRQLVNTLLARALK